jgi:quercetin dioxygenase-like cupin family protein
LRDFFLYRDLGIAAATGGRVIARMVKVNTDMPPEQSAGWHRHVAGWHMVPMTQCWAKFMYEDKVTLVAAGDCVHQRLGIVHHLYDYSPDMEYLEVVGPADFGTVRAEGPCEVPAPIPWGKT